MADIIQLRGGTAATATSENPILHEREIGIETDTLKMKIGNGVTAWNSLPYVGGIGDMEKSVYDADNDGVVDNSEKLNNQSASYYLNADNHADGTTNKVFSATNRTKLSNITVTGAVNLDTMNTRLNDLDAAVVLKGTWSASSGVFPGSGTAQAGWSYLVTSDGTVDGIEFKIGDRIISILDNASTSVYASNWYKADYTDRVSTVAGRTGAVVITSSDLADFVAAVLSNAPAETSSSIGTLINGSSSKPSPADADIFGYGNSAAGNTIVKITWSELAAALQNIFDAVYGSRLVTMNRQTANYTLAITDKHVDMNSASANTCTVPPNSSVPFENGTQILVTQYNSGQTTIGAGAGVTIRSSGSKYKLSARYAGATLLKVGTDEWYLFGDLTT